VKTGTFVGHGDIVTSIAACGDFLFSADRTKTYRKWNIQGECLQEVTNHTSPVRILLVYNQDVYSGSEVGIIRR